MAQFIFVYHGGGMPKNPADAEKEMAKWGAWMEAETSSFVNPGAPVGMSKTISSDGIADNGGANPVSGFSIVEAADMEAACKIAQGCPISGTGGSVEVAEMMKM